MMMLIGLVFSIGTASADTANVLEVSVQNGETVGFSMEDLEAIWQEEGSNTYTYSTYNTWPTFETEEHYGPTVKAVLSAAGINAATLAEANEVRSYGWHYAPYFANTVDQMDACLDNFGLVSMIESDMFTISEAMARKYGIGWTDIPNDLLN